MTSILNVVLSYPTHTHTITINWDTTPGSEYLMVENVGEMSDRDIKEVFRDLATDPVNFPIASEMAKECLRMVPYFIALGTDHIPASRRLYRDGCS